MAACGSDPRAGDVEEDASQLIFPKGEAGGCAGVPPPRVVGPRRGAGSRLRVFALRDTGRWRDAAGRTVAVLRACRGGNARGGRGDSGSQGECRAGTRGAPSRGSEPHLGLSAGALFGPLSVVPARRLRGARVVPGMQPCAVRSPVHAIIKPSRAQIEVPSGGGLTGAWPVQEKVFGR